MGIIKNKLESMKVESCCLCVPIDLGVKIIGVLVLLGLFTEMEHFVPIRAVALGITLLAFANMFMNGNAQSRLIAYAAYIFNCLVDGALFFFFLKPDQGGYSIDTWAKQACDGMNETDLEKFTAEHGDCEPAMKNYIFYATGVGFTIGTLITIHFILVLYTYWQQAVEEEEGDTKVPGDDEEPLMQ